MDPARDLPCSYELFAQIVTVTAAAVRVRTPRARADRRAHVQAAGRVGDADRVCLRGRHLGGAQAGRRGSAAELATGEEQFPRFSPDGARIAFSANYDGNVDVYVVPTQGGDPVRVTHHPMPDRLVDWHPDGARVLFVSSRESGRQRYSQFFLAPATGGLPAKLAVPYGEFGSFSPDGSKIAYLPQTQAFRTWKRYRGGWSPDIWEFDLTTLAAKNVTTNDAVDEFPMWHGDIVYFLSDRGAGQKQNIWARNRATGAVRQVTDFRDYDVSFPSLGPGDIVFVAGSQLYLLDLASEKVSEVHVQVVTDRSTLKSRSVKVNDAIASVSVSPTGKRAAFEARGEIFSVPAENGPVMSVSRSSGVAERYPRWSPDGKTLAYWSDRSGEYELTLRPADGTGAERTLTSLGVGFRYPPQWSPDSTRMAFVDQAMKIRVVDVATGRVVEVDQSPIWMAHGQLETPAAAMVARLALAHVGAWHVGVRQSGGVLLRRHEGRRGTRRRPDTSTTPTRCSTPTASTSTSSRTGPSTPSTATSTTAGRIPIPPASSP